MSSTLEKPAGGVRSDNQERASNEALLGHLFASKPARERRLGPWLIAALLHIPLLIVFLVTDYGERVLGRAELLIRPILTVADNPPEIKAPAPIIVIEPAPVPRAERPSERTVGPPPALTAPGLPDPNAIERPVSGEPTRPPGDVVGPPGSGGSLADRMAAPPTDPRLFAPADPSGLLTGPEGARARMADRLTQYNDSVAAERLAAANATDWTITDKDGKRWGVSPGKLHLGGITLPLPLAFNTPPGRRDEVNAQLRNWSEIQAQVVREGNRDSFEDRVKEIRKRKDRERAEKTAQRIADKKKPD